MGVTAAGLIEKFRQEQDRTFAIHLEGGEKLTFRFPKNADEYIKLRQKGERFAKMATGGRVPEDWKPFQPETKEVAIQAFWVSELAVEPEITQPAALQMAAECGALIPFLHGIIVDRIGSTVAESEAAELDEAGEGFGATSSGETTSPSPVTSTTATPKN
jgi:hypothetical protein